MYCRNCGKEIPDGTKFCGHCGFDLREDVPEKKADSPSSPAATAGGGGSAAKIALISVIAVLAVVAGLLVWLILGRNRQQETASSQSQAQTESVAESAGGTSEEMIAVSPDPDTAAVSEVEPVPQMPESGFDALADWAKDVWNGNLQLVTTDASAYPEMKLYFSYSDSQGEPITLASPTAGIKESIAGGDLIEREIIRIEQLEGNEGIGIELLADKSGSMEYDMPQMQQVMRDFVNSLDYAMGDHVEIITFDSYIMYMCNDTNQVEYLRNGIDSMTPYGQTALYDALYVGVQNAANREGANVVIAFTDGLDNMSSRTEDEVIALAKNLDVPVYLVGMEGVDASILRRICQETGGAYWDISAVGDLSEIYGHIYSAQKQMYCVTYKSDPSADPYQERTISCALTDETSGCVLQATPFTPVKKAEEVKHESRYEIIAGDISWTEANDAALKKGGHLATITSQAEMDQLVGMAEKAGLKYIWIGGYTSVRDNKAFGHWTTGEPFDYTAWFPGEPSRNDRDGTPEFYLMLWNVQDGWSWNDQRDDVLDTGLDYFKGKMGYLVEYEQ